MSMDQKKTIDFSQKPYFSIEKDQFLKLVDELSLNPPMNKGSVAELFDRFEDIQLNMEDNLIGLKGKKATILAHCKGAWKLLAW